MVGCAFAVASMSRKLWISSLKISQLPKFSWRTDLSSLRSQYIRTRPLIAFSRKIGASFSIVVFSSCTCDKRLMKSSQLSFDRRVCDKSCGWWKKNYWGSTAHETRLPYQVNRNRRPHRQWRVLEGRRAGVVLIVIHDMRVRSVEVVHHRDRRVRHRVHG